MAVKDSPLWLHVKYLGDFGCFCANNGENGHTGMTSGLSLPGRVIFPANWDIFPTIIITGNSQSSGIKGESNPMKVVISFLIAVTALSGMALAQEGYPLDGTWRGEWTAPGGDKTMTVVVMNWDGNTINGRINPGRNMIFFEQASLDPENWTVRFSSTTKAGEPVEFEGELENIGSYNRTITGTWTVADVENELTLTRE